MEMCSRSSFKSTWLIYAAITAALQAQKLNVQHDVTGYLGTDVTLSCHLIDTTQFIIEIKWILTTPEGEMKSIITLKHNNEVSISGSSLMGRVEITRESLKIKDVTLADTGSYTCIISALLGTAQETIKLVVKQQTHSITPRMISTGVFVLIIVIMAATTYLIIYKIRHKASDKSHVNTGAENAMIDTSQL